MKFLAWIVSVAVMASLSYGAVYYYFGESCITVTDEQGKPVTTVVTVNGIDIGKTPFTKRLGPGKFEIKLKLPDGFKSIDPPGYTLTTAVMGFNMAAVVTRPTYKVVLDTPANVSNPLYLVTDAEGKAIGSCDGHACEVPLPKAGVYFASYTDEHSKGGPFRFEVTPTQDIQTVGWQ